MLERSFKGLWRICPTDLISYTADLLRNIMHCSQQLYKTLKEREYPDEILSTRGRADYSLGSLITQDVGNYLWTVGFGPPGIRIVYHLKSWKIIPQTRFLFLKGTQFRRKYLLDCNSQGAEGLEREEDPVPLFLSAFHFHRAFLQPWFYFGAH